MPDPFSTLRRVFDVHDGPEMVRFVIRCPRCRAVWSIAPGSAHAAVTDALDRGVDVRTVQRFSRHTDLKTLLIYDDNRADLGGAWRASSRRSSRGGRPPPPARRIAGSHTVRALDGWVRPI